MIVVSTTEVGWWTEYPKWANGVKRERLEQLPRGQKYGRILKRSTAVGKAEW
jgi:hypothetical protein